MDFYATLNDRTTYSDANGASVFSLNEQNEIRVYDLMHIVKHLQETNQLDNFLTDSTLDDDILLDLDIDEDSQGLTQALSGSTIVALEL